jgi:hypothetical protein
MDVRRAVRVPSPTPFRRDRYTVYIPYLAASASNSNAGATRAGELDWGDVWPGMTGLISSATGRLNPGDPLGLLLLGLILFPLIGLVLRYAVGLINRGRWE